MRAIIVIIVLGLLYMLVKNSTDLDVGLEGINSVLLGYGALFAAGIVTAELLRPLLSMMGATSRFVVVAVIAGLVWFAFETARTNGVIPAAMLNPTNTPEQDEPINQTRLVLAWDGVFRAVAQVNNMSLGVLVDTGTPLVVLQHGEAERLGLHPERLKFDQRLTIADRKITVALLPLLSVRIDDIEVFEVEAAIAAPGALEANIVGLSFLNRLSTTAIVDNELYLRQ